MPLLHDQIHVADTHALNPDRAPAVQPDTESSHVFDANTATLGTGVESAGAGEGYGHGHPPDKTRAELSRDDVTLAPSAHGSAAGYGAGYTGDKRGMDAAGNIKSMDAVLEDDGDGVWGKMGEGSPNYKNVGW